MGGGAWPFLVGGAICPVNSVNERDLSLLTSYAEDPSAASFLEGLWPLRPRKFEAITDHCNCWSSTRNSYVRIAATWVVRCPRRREKSTEPYHLEEGEPLGRGHACLGVTRRCPPIYSFGIAGGRMMASRAPRRAVGINAKSSATHATTIGGCETSVARRVRSSRIEGSKKLLGSGSAFNATPGCWSIKTAGRWSWKSKSAKDYFEKVRLLEAWHGMALAWPWHALPWLALPLACLALRWAWPWHALPWLALALACLALGMPWLALRWACLGLPCVGHGLGMRCLGLRCLWIALPCVGHGLGMRCLGLRWHGVALPCVGMAYSSHALLRLCLALPWHAVPMA
ncbi:unnamed protein product [Prunus brigantina]